MRDRSPTPIGMSRLLCIGALVTATAAAAQPGAGPPRAPAAPNPATYGLRHAEHGVTVLSDVTYAAYRGFRPLKLDLYLAAASEPARPLVIWLHGGGWMGGDQTGGGIATPAYGDWPAQLAGLAAHGYVVASVSYRLSAEAKSPAAIQDVKAAVRWLRANAKVYEIDPTRIVVWGGSAGGQLAALLGTSCGVPELEGAPVLGPDTSSCVQGVIDFYGPTDLRQMDAQRLPAAAPVHDAATSAESAYLGCPLTRCDADRLRLSNPIAFVDRSDPPFLIIHGDADTNGSPKQSQILYDALTAAGVQAELVFIPGANHIFAGATDAQGKAIMAKVTEFLDRTITASSKK